MHIFSPLRFQTPALHSPLAMSSLRSLLTAALFIGFLFLTGCPTTPELDPEPKVRSEVRFELPRTAFPDFLALPWPSDLHHREVNGEYWLDLRSFPNPTKSAVLEEFIALFQTAKGWQGAPTFYIEIPAGLNEESLPASAQDSMSNDSSLYLLDLETGSRLPLVWKYLAEKSTFLPQNTLQVQLLMGARLTHPSALILTAEANDKAGVPLGPSSDLLSLMQCVPLENQAELRIEPDCTFYKKAAELAKKNTGISIEDLALVQVITPAKSEEELQIAAKTIRAMPPPALSQLTKRALNYDLYDVYSGVIDMAQFQVGTPPFYDFDGIQGKFEFDENGIIIQEVVPVEFTLTVPKGTPPAQGWPVTVYGHGTGGSLDTPLGNRSTDEAYTLAEAGWAMLTTSDPIHRGRLGYVEGEEELYTFNMLNPVAGRNTFRQSALEKVQLISAVENLFIPSNISEESAIEFNEDKISYMGHSQGGIVGALVLGIENRLQGAFLSGAGAGFAPSLVAKTSPVNLMDVFKALLSLPEDEPVDIFHPVLALLQLWVDPADPINYADGWRKTNTHLAMTSGLLDVDTPRVNHDAMAGIFRLPQVKPIRDPIEILEINGINSIENGSSANLQGPTGPLSAGIMQYEFDGHFAIYQNPDATNSYRVFFTTLNEGIPILKVE